MFVLLLINSLKMNCFPIDRFGKNLERNKLSFLKVSIPLPSGLNNEDTNNIRYTLKRYEYQATQLQNEAKFCKISKPISCFVISKRLQVLLEWFSKYVYVVLIILFTFFRN